MTTVDSPPMGLLRSSSSSAADKKRRREARTGWLFMAPFMLLFAVTFLVPIIVSVISSFYGEASTGGGIYGGGELETQFVGLQNFIVAVSNSSFWIGMGRVVLYGLFQIPVMIFGALLLALLLDSFIVRGGR